MGLEKIENIKESLEIPVIAKGVSIEFEKSYRKAMLFHYQKSHRVFGFFKGNY